MMTSYQDNIPFMPSTKLPNINGGGRSESHSTLSFRNTLHWVGPLRKKLDYATNYNGQPHEEDLANLVKELTKVMISALQPTVSKQAWLDLNHVLKVMQPYKDFLDSPSMLHYVERLFHFYSSNMEKLFDIPIIDNLRSVFPYGVEYAQAHYDNSSTVTSRQGKKMRPSQSADYSLLKSVADSAMINPNSLPDGRNPYSLLRRGDEPERHFKGKHLKLSNIDENLPHVAMESAASEAIWREGESATVAAIGVKLPFALEAISGRTSSCTSGETLRDVVQDSSVKKAEEFVSFSGRQAVELFLKQKHLHKVTFIYLNKSSTKEYRPYDLVSVPREKLEKEHYIFSTFGVLHVYPDGNHSETLTLADWNKNAVLWGILRTIPFFKNYLTKKAFSRWLQNTRRIKFNRTRAIVSSLLLHSVPDFGCALLHVFRLMHELSEIKFLPGSPSVTCQYTIKEFEADSYKIKLDVNRILDLFFRYCKKVIDTTKESCFEQLKFYEYQAKQKRPLFIKESLYLQRRKHEARAKKLRMARIVSRRVPAFITLVDQAISVHLVAVARSAITHFVEDVLTMQDDQLTEESLSTVTESIRTKGSSGNKDPVEILRSVFAAKFIFNKTTHCLEMYPSVNEFRAVMKESVDGILRLMCDRARTMHSLRRASTVQRPGSAPASYGSSASEANVSVRTSVSSFDAESRSSFSEKQEPRRESVAPGPNDDQQDGMDSNLVNALTEPRISIQELPTKDDENEAVATPDMVVPPGRTGMLGLMVGGEALLGYHSPLDQSKLFEKMMQDPEITKAIEEQNGLVDAAVTEVIAFSEEQNEWIADIRHFTSSWNELEIEKWKERPAREIEQQLNVIKAWIEKVKDMDRAIVTTNKLLFVDCRMPANALVPQLNSIFRKLIGVVVGEAKLFAEQVTEEAKEALKVLKNKNTDVKSFAEYASIVTASQKRKLEMAEKVTYIRSLYEVVRMTYRQLTPEEEKLEEKMKSTWEAFLFQLKDATNFVTNQRPIILKHLDEVFASQYEQTLKNARKASTGLMVDPKANENEVISALEKSISTFQEQKNRLRELSRYKESASGEKYNLDDLEELGAAMEHRLELWKYVSVAKEAIADWKATPFRKFNAQNALEKVNEWQKMSQTLQEHLPDKDPVLKSWCETLDQMSEDLPVLQDLSNDAMKPRHWREVFTGMGETYEAGWTFTVEELLAYKPAQFTEIIGKVHRGAAAEYQLEQLMRRIKRQWEERQFQLAKHIHLVQMPISNEADTIGSTKNLTGTQEKRPSKHSQKMFYSQEIDSDTFILVRVDDLLRDLLESHVTLQEMLQSRHAFEVRADAEIWSDTLQQIGEIVNLWVSCQDKWMYLSKVFCGDPSFTNRFKPLKPKFEEIDARYREFISAMVQDPKVLSVLSRLHGHKGWRELQGDILRRHLLSCIQQEEEILRTIDILLEDFRFQFPRLYFLSDDDCVRLLGVSRQPKALVPFVKKCFPGIRSLTFDLPHLLSTKQMKDTLSFLDMELYSHKLEVTCIHGTFKDPLRISALTAHNDATVWLGALEQKMKNALMSQLKSLVEMRLREETQNVADAFTELCEVETFVSAEDLSSHVYKHWILKYPSQAVLLSNAIIWYHNLAKFFHEGALKDHHEDIKKETIYKLKQFGQSMQTQAATAGKSTARRRLHSLLSALVMQTVYHRDLLRSIEQNDVTSTATYEWQSILKHRADITMYNDYFITTKSNTASGAASNFIKTALVGDCYVDHLDSRDDYGYEFIGMNKSSDTESSGVCAGTVITPLTERCFVNLSLARRMNQCGVLFGPSSVGKSLSITALAQAFGRTLINLTCSEDLTMKVLKRCLRGVVESGAWICFDNANRLQQTALSQLSQYIKQIQYGYSVLEETVKSEYDSRGDDGFRKLKRSNSITTLHRTTDVEASHLWQAEVSSTFQQSMDYSAADDNDWRDAFASWAKPDLKQLGSLVFEDKLLTVKPGFAMFMTFATEPGKCPEVPENLKQIYRPMCLIKPDVPKLIEVWLQASGFTDSANLAKKLCLTYQMLQATADHISGDTAIAREFACIAGISLNSLRSIVALASRLASQAKTQQRSRAESVCDAPTPGDHPPSSSSSATSISRSSRRSELILMSHNEEQALVSAIVLSYTPKLGSSAAITRFKENLRNIFPTSARPAASKERGGTLAETIRLHMINDGLQPAEEWIDKACQLAVLLQLNQSVVIAGAAGSGKTTICRTLVKALNALTTASYMGGFRDSKTPIIPLRQNTKGKQDASNLSISPNETSLSGGFSNQGFDDFHGLLPEDFNSRIDLTTIFPNVHNVSELFGYFDSQNEAWRPGLLSKLMKECHLVDKKRLKLMDKKEGLADMPEPSIRQKSLANEFIFTQSSLKKWIVLDGEMLPSWIDSISCLLDDHNRAHLSNMEDVVLPSSTNVIFECANFASASPAVASRCAILHCNVPENWRHVATSWLDAAYNKYSVTRATIKTLCDLVDDIVPPLLSFFQEGRESVLKNGLTHSQKKLNGAGLGMRQINALFDIFSSCLTSHHLTREAVEAEVKDDNSFDKTSPIASGISEETQSTRGSSVRSRLDDGIPNSHHEIAMKLFAFAFVWAFGGDLHESEMARFDVVLRNAFRRSRHDILIPPYETVYDYFVDDETESFSLWEDRIDLRPHAGLPNDSSYISLHQTERYAYIAATLLGSQKSVLMVGEPGVGKSSLVKHVLQADFDICKIPMSPGLSALHFQRLIESKASPLSKQHNLGLMAHPNAVIASRSASDQSVLFFLDDLSFTASTTTTKTCSVATQPCLELLRQVFSLHGVYELDRLLFKSLENDLAFVATATKSGIPGSGLGSACHALSPRLTRNFTVLHFLKPSKDTILSMHHGGVQSWLEEFPAYSLVRHYDLSQAIISGTYEVYSLVRAHLKPSSQQPHYLFSLHDINRIMQARAMNVACGNLQPRNILHALTKGELPTANGLFLLSPRNRTRPKPIRRKAPGGETRLRPGGAGKHARRFKGNRTVGDPAAGVAPMMKVVVRLWLHECTRVFHDRLCSDDDRRWFSRSLYDVLKKQFCTSKDKRSLSPAIEKVRIIKTPIPASGSQQSSGSPQNSPRSIDLAASSTVGDETDTYLQSSPNNSALQAGYDADESIGSDGSVVSQTQHEIYLAEVQETSTAPSPYDGSSSASFVKASDYYDTDVTQSSTTKVQSSTPSHSTQEMHLAVPSTSSLQETSIDDVMSETTTFNQAQTSTSGDYESRATTAVTRDDDGVSTATGFTAGQESECESEMIDESNGSQFALSAAGSANKDYQSDSVAKPQNSALYPASGSSEDEGAKPKRSEALLPKQSRPSRPGGARLGVTFVPGLIEDADNAADTSEPLLALHEVLQENEEATSVIFSHGILPAALDSKPGTDGYFQSTEAQLSKALKIALESYNDGMAQDDDRMELVFFGQAVRHAARLSRALCMKRGHSLLLSSSRFTGRRSLTKLLAFLSRAKIFSLDSSVQNGKEDMRKALKDLIKKASRKAGIQNKKAVLMIDGPVATDPECLNDICSVIREGQCPALYTHRELARIASEVAPGKANVISTATASDSSLAGGKLTATDKIDQYLDKYFAHVLANLHIVILVDCPDVDGSCVQPSERNKVDSYFHSDARLRRFHLMLKSCPDLITQFCCIDFYRAWDHSSLQMVASHFIEAYSGLQNGQFAAGSDGVKMPWNTRASPSQQIQDVSHILAYIHSDVLARTKVSLSSGAEEITNPLIFQQMVQVFIGISKTIQANEYREIRRFEKALKKVHEAEVTIKRLYERRNQLLPMLKDARDCEHSWEIHVEEERQEYDDAQERCTAEEENIERLERELSMLSKQSKAVTKKMKPLFESAAAALAALTPQSLDELKRYPKPPEAALLTVNCLCHMFEVSPANWENGKALISREKFFQDLQFYDKDDIPAPTFHTITRYVHTPEFQPEYVAIGSKAASQLCVWVHAIYHYAKTLRTLQPIMDAQKDLQVKLKAAQAMLGSKRVRCYQIKAELDSKLQKHNLAIESVLEHEQALGKLEAEIFQADTLANCMQKHVDLWKEQKKQATSRIQSAIGDSVVVAAAITYFGPLSVEQRNLAIASWVNACMNGYIDIDLGTFKVSTRNRKPSTATEISSQENEINSLFDDNDDADSFDAADEPDSNEFLQVRGNLKALDILSSSSQQRLWHKAGLSRDVEARFDALRLRALCLHQDLTWCLLYDPDQQAVTWLQTIFDDLRKDMESGSFSTPTSCLSRQSQQSTTSDASLSESLGVTDSSGLSSAMSVPASDIETTTEVTISVTTKGVVRTESAKRVQSAPSKEVRFVESPRNAKTDSRVRSAVIGEDIDVEIATDLENANVDQTPPFHPLDKLWVCKATDSCLPQLLASATSHGAIVYVTNIEQASLENFDYVMRRPIDSNIHQNFRLFLGTSIPIELALQTAPRLRPVPIHRYSITNLALSDEGLAEQLEKVVLNQERSEFEAQRRLMEADVFHLEQHMEQLQDKMLSRVSETKTAVLSDKNIYDVFIQYERDTTTAAASLRETQHMENNLMLKKSDLAQVALYGRQLFSAYEATTHLQPHIYKLSASQFLELYTRCMAAHVRGKNSGPGSGGSGSLIKSRTVELKQGLTETMMDLAERRMVEPDALIFATLVTFETMKNSHKITEKEMEELIGIGEKLPQLPLADDVISLDKPAWMSEAKWSDMLCLVRRHPAVFSGLTRSVSEKPKLWQEYFEYSPVLLAKVPCPKLQSLTLGQKALLWKTMCPETFSRVISDLNTSVLGGVTARRNVLDLDAMLQDLAPSKPCCFILPENSQDTCYLPAVHVQQRARSRGIQYIERSAEFGDELGDLLEMCMITGGWLLLHSCHLATKWPDKFLQLLTYLVDSDKNGSYDQAGVFDTPGTTKRSISTTTEADGAVFVSEIIKEYAAQFKRPCDPKFRLWFVTRGNESLVRSLPMQVLYQAELVTVKMPTSHKELVKITHRLLSRFGAGMRRLDPPTAPLGVFDKRSFIPSNVRTTVTRNPEVTHHLRIMLKLSLLHGILLDRARFGKSSFAAPCNWTDGDTTGAVSSVAVTRNTAVASRLCAAVMNGHIPETRDLEAAQSLTDIVLKMKPGSKNCLLTQSLEKVMKQWKNSRTGFDTLLHKPDLKKLGLHSTADKSTTERASAKISVLLGDISAMRASRRGLLWFSDAEGKLARAAEEIRLKRTLESLVLQLEEAFAPEFNKHMQSPVMAEFYSAEVKRLELMIEVARTDLSLCLSLTKGETEATEEVRELLRSVAENTIPGAWLHSQYDLLRFHRSSHLTRLVNSIGLRSTLLEKYMGAASDPVSARDLVSPDMSKSEHGSPSNRCSSTTQTLFTYNLSAFCRPDLFLMNTLLSVARARYHDAHKYKFAMQFLTADGADKLAPVQPQHSPVPFETFCIDGLYLHNAIFDRKSGTIHETKSNVARKMPLLQLRAEKTRFSSRYNGQQSANQQGGAVFNCPLWLNENKMPDMCASSDIVIHVPIPVEDQLDKWLTQGTALLSQLENH